MHSLPIAVATRRFLQPLKQSLQTAAKIGAGGVQLDVRNELNPADLSETGCRQLLHYLDELSLDVSSLSFASRKRLFDLDNIEPRLEAVRTAMQFAFRMQARFLTVQVGRIPSEGESTDYQMLSEILNDLAKYGNHVGSTLLITPSGDSAESLLQLISTVTQGPIGINFDPAPFVFSGQNPLEALRVLHSSVMHIRVRDALSDIDGNGLEVPVGRGEVVWDEFLALLEEAGYQGWLTIDRTQGDDKTGDIANAVQFLRNVAFG
jgi:sugar phosphate isomerase/epimerase